MAGSPPIWFQNPPPRLWLGPQHTDLNPGLPQVRLLRRCFQLDHPWPDAVRLHLFAEARYHLYVNGRYVTRGPSLHHPHRLPVAIHDLTTLVQPGPNVLAILVHDPGCGLHNLVRTGRPGVVAELVACDAAGGGGRVLLRSDQAWRITDRHGWSNDVPRRGWAIGYIEHFDAAAHPWGWTDVAFDDSAWSAPQVHDTALPGPEGQACYVMETLPPLRHDWRPAMRVLSFAQVHDPAPPIRADYRHGDYARLLMEQPWHEPTRVHLHGSLDDAGGGLRLEDLRPEIGAVLNLDLGQEHSGRITLECDCPTTGVIDVGWSEFADDDLTSGRAMPRPRILQKGMSYADRVMAAAGSLQWSPYQFNAGRYLSLWFRGFEGSLTIRRVGMLASEPKLDWPARFESGDERLDGIWSLCRRTLAVGTQEAMMDCPTREQAFYVGDGHPIGQWIAQTSGDTRHWRYLVREQFARQAANGLIRSTPFSWRDDTLIDYNLIAIIGTRDYWRWSGDAESVRDLIEPCRRILQWFDRQCDGRGLFAWRWDQREPAEDVEHVYDPHGPRVRKGLNLFIDHPGMGWHNMGEPGIDRRGTNAAINALLVRAREAMAELEQAFGSLQQSQAMLTAAEQLREAAHTVFFDPRRGVYVDGELAGRRLEQISQQTNGWAVQAGLSDEAQARRAMLAVLDSANTDVARAGPYFWFYLFPVLASLGMHQAGLDAIRRQWGRMLDRGATTLWETFSGDDNDSACHAWSGAPLEFLLTAIAGLPWTARAGQTVELRPRFDLLDRCRAAIATPAGLVEIAWRPIEGGVHLEGRLPSEVVATLIDPRGSVSGVMRDAWTQTWAAPAPGDVPS